ncbi:MAG: diguanylate cyclase [Rhodospirillaceae bacterium]|nr:diguanylate cyclase [Rhodospirillaceae bacterium]
MNRLKFSKLLPQCGLESILDALPLAIFLKDTSLHYTWCNARFEEICGCSKDEIPGKTALDIFLKNEAEATREIDLAVLNTGERRIHDTQITCLCGQHIDVRLLKIPATNRSGEVVGIVGIAIDITKDRDTERDLIQALSQVNLTNDSLQNFANDLQSSLAFTEDNAAQLAELVEQIEAQKQSISDQNDKIRSLMYRDDNTGIHNRRYFFDTMPKIIEHKHDTDGFLATIDIDRFKRINDTHGHAYGDRALRAFTEIAANVIPEDCLFCRIGGEEFAVASPSIPITEGLELLDRLRRTISENLLSTAAAPLKYTISAGITPLFDGANLDDLLRTADTALYQAKRSGRNRVILAKHLISSQDPLDGETAP